MSILSSHLEAHQKRAPRPHLLQPLEPFHHRLLVSHRKVAEALWSRLGVRPLRLLTDNNRLRMMMNTIHSATPLRNTVFLFHHQCQLGE